MELTFTEATYQGKKVTLNKPFRTPSESKKFKNLNDLIFDKKGNIYTYDMKKKNFYLSSSNYLQFSHKHKTYTVHREIAKRFIPNPENKPCINHKNGIKTDNRVKNLEWCTYSENLKHAYKNKLYIKTGEKHNLSKLKEIDVINIKKRLLNKEYCKDIAKDYNVSEWVIFNIKQKRNWKHVHI